MRFMCIWLFNLRFKVTRFGHSDRDVVFFCRDSDEACSWGRHKTSVVRRNRNSLTFGRDVGGVANPIIVHFDGAVNVKH